jgi:glutamate-ammonia-ligase adenylyltransferase
MEECPFRPSWLSPAFAALLDAHKSRIPDPGRAMSLLGRWAESRPLPGEELLFLDLAYLAGTSEPLFLALLSNERRLKMVSAQSRIAGGLGAQKMDEALGRHLMGVASSETAAGLALFKLLQSARILLQDIHGFLSFEEVTRELSLLAEVLIQRALAVTYQELRERLGMPQKLGADGRPVQASLVVFGLGKLGGNELNYSSDVDLVFFYEEEGETDRGVSNSAFFNAWVRQAIALLSRPTIYGACLRIDPNLRPRGRDGELTLSFGAALGYYRAFAETWERQAWVKARPVAGDLSAGEQFLKQMGPLIYRPVPAEVVGESVRSMRLQTLSHLEKSLGNKAETDIKEGPGGLRDAEFGVQALQLAFGPKDPWLRDQGTLMALARLRQRGLIGDAQRGEVVRAYLLLRRAEHFAQVQGMRQAHGLPESDEGMNALARFLAFEGTPELRRALEQSRAALSRFFAEVVERLGAGRAERYERDILAPESLREMLVRANIRDAGRALPLFTEAALSIAREAAAENREVLVASLDALVEEISASPDPFQALLSLCRLVPSLASQPGLVGYLASRPMAFSLLLRLVVRCPALFDWAQRWPELAANISFDALRATGESFASILPPSASGEPLRFAHKQALFRFAAAATLMPDLDIGFSHKWHTRLASEVVDAALAEAASALEGKEGLAKGALIDKVCLLGLGRLGFEEMLPGSDLDVVLLKDREWLFPEAPERSASLEIQLVRGFVRALTGVTRYGALYPVDLRLRPHGDSGPPIVSSEALLAYFGSQNAQEWERLSYLKARPVAGNLSLGKPALEALWEKLQKEPLPEGSPSRLIELLSRLDKSAPSIEGEIKFSPGGLFHLNTLLLLLQRRFGVKREAGGTLALMKRLEEAGALEAGEALALRASWAWQERLLLNFRMLFARPLARRDCKSAFEALSAASPGFARAQEKLRAHRETVLASWRSHIEKSDW